MGHRQGPISLYRPAGSTARSRARRCCRRDRGHARAIVVGHDQMQGMRSGSAHCPTPIEKPLLPVCGSFLAPRSKHLGEGSTSGTVVVSRIIGPIRRLRPVEVRDVEFLRANTDRTVKITLPGPFTMSRQAKNEFYKDEEELVMDYAVAVNAEIRDLKAAGADVIQLDEPWLQARAEEARRLALPAIDKALDGIPGPTALHLCFGYAYVARDK